MSPLIYLKQLLPNFNFSKRVTSRPCGILERSISSNCGAQFYIVTVDTSYSHHVHRDQVRDVLDLSDCPEITKRA